MKRITLLFALIIFSISLSAQKEIEDTSANELLRQIKLIDSINKAMKWVTGKVDLPNGISTLNIPEGFKYLGTEQSNYVITEVWGNPPREGVLGMIFPEYSGPFGDSSYAFVISYDAMGYVKDEDADKIDYDDMLKQLQKEEVKENEERVKQGYPPIHFAGWASKPFYDKQNKVLHWAKELKFGNGEEGNTLNYEIRLLGRKGVLSMNAVSGMGELPLVKKDIDKVLAMASFTDGNAYKDFDSNADEVAAWTIGGLVAGKVLAKAGILALILKNIKLVILAIAAVGGGVWRFITGRKKKQEEALTYETPVTEPPAPEQQA